jgi:hypothetical protein
VNRWQELIGPSTAEFGVMYQNKLTRNQQRKLLRISIMAIPGIAGKGFDWVKKKDRKRGPGYRFIGMRVGHVLLLTSEVTIFSPEATSTF